MSFTGLLVISVIAVAAPILAASVKRLKLPSVVVEIVAGIIVGPSVLSWVKIDQLVRVLEPHMYSGGPCGAADGALLLVVLLIPCLSGLRGHRVWASECSGC